MNRTPCAAADLSAELTVAGISCNLRSKKIDAELFCFTILRTSGPSLINNSSPILKQPTVSRVYEHTFRPLFGSEHPARKSAYSLQISIDSREIQVKNNAPSKELITTFLYVYSFTPTVSQILEFLGRFV